MDCIGDRDFKKVINDKQGHDHAVLILTVETMPL